MSPAASLGQGGVPVALEPQVFGFLVLLVRNPGRVVARDEIIEHVWSGQIVSESAVSSRINALRKALDDDGSAQRLVRSVHVRGFRIGTTPETVTAPTPEAALSRFRDIAVIAWNSSLTYTRRAVPTHSIATELGMKYLLLASVRQVSPRIRVAVQLIGATRYQAIFSDHGAAR